jgi:hypothetical protein
MSTGLGTRNDKNIEELTATLEYCLLCNDDDRGREVNISGAILKLHESSKAIANAITPLGAAPGTDASGGFVSSLTEAVMGVSAGLSSIAEAINDLAMAVREHGE